MQAWNVYRPTPRGLEHIDTVFYDANCDADYVRNGLIDHDGYDPNIVVRKA